MEAEMAQHLQNKRDQSPPGNRPNMSDLRIVLVGKNVSENNRVGNLIFNKNMFGKITPQPDVETFMERVERRNITVFNTTQLLNATPSLKEIAQYMSNMSPPEPHVIILVLQLSDFSQKNRDMLPSVLNCFGEQAMKCTMILTTDDETRSAEHKIENEYIKEISTECGGGCLQLAQHTQHSQILQKVDEIISHGVVEETQHVSSLHEEDHKRLRRRSQSEEHPNVDIREWIRSNMPANFSGKQKLNLVLCGSDPTFKVSVSKLLRGKTIKSSHQREGSVEFVKKEERIHGRQISLVELPALSQLSEEEVMRQTLKCVSLCDPGVHVFLLIVPVGPLTDEDKTEIEKIQKNFYSREHFIVMFISEGTVERPETDFIKYSSESQSLISRCGGQYCVMGLKEHDNSRQIPELLDYIENMKTEPYSLQMYVKAQENRVGRETEEKYKEKLKKMEDEIKELKQKIQSEESSDQELREMEEAGAQQ